MKVDQDVTEKEFRELSGDLKQRERLNRMLELLATHGRISVHDAVEAFGVSGATIRRDLDHLASQQLIRRTRGGAVAMITYDLPLGYKADKNLEGRQRIGSLAASVVEAGDVVGIAGGPLALEVARSLSARAEFVDHVEAITVVTNAVNVAYELSRRPHIRLLVTGGTVHLRSSSMAGEIAKESVRRYRLDHLFIEADGITDECFTVRDDTNAEILAEFIKNARNTVALVDQRALESASFARVCGLDRISSIVTDASDAPPTLGGVKVLRA